MQSSLELSPRLGPARKYDRAAAGWRDKIDRLGYPAAYRDLLRSAVPRALPVGARILDVGCGAGDMSCAVLDTLNPSRPSLTLVDPSARMLRQAADRMRDRPAKLATHAGTLEVLPHDACFDLILAGHVLEHCADPAHAVQCLAKCLAPGGRMVLVVSRPHWCNWLIWLRWQHRWFPEATVTGWLRGAGLEQVAAHRLTGGAPARTSLGYSARAPISKERTSC